MIFFKEKKKIKDIEKKTNKTADMFQTGSMQKASGKCIQGILQGIITI